MYKTNPLLIEKCRTLRRKGFTLGEIIKATNLPKTTIFDHVRDIPLSIAMKKRLVRENTSDLKKLPSEGRESVFQVELSLNQKDGLMN